MLIANTHDESDDTTWWLDSEATSHMTSHQEWFSSLQENTNTKKKVFMENDNAKKIQVVGTIPIQVGPTS